MNGSSVTGAIPTYDISGNGNNGWGGNMGEWILGIVALGMLSNGSLFGGNGNYGNGGMFPWLMTGQAGINQNTNYGFGTLHLSNQIEGVRDGVAGLSTQLCGSTADIVQAVNNGFYGAEISAGNRQLSYLNGLNNINTSLLNCCCENRLATCQTQNTIISEGNATRFADANNTRDIITNATSNTQAILDKLCQLELDGKNTRIAELERQNLMLSLDKSQTAQNAFISQGFANEVDALYNRLSNCPVPSTPVYGRTPIFTCGGSCGCSGNFTTSQFI